MDRILLQETMHGLGLIMDILKKDGGSSDIQNTSILPSIALLHSNIQKNIGMDIFSSLPNEIILTVASALGFKHSGVLRRVSKAFYKTIDHGFLIKECLEVLFRYRRGKFTNARLKEFTALILEWFAKRHPLYESENLKRFYRAVLEDRVEFYNREPRATIMLDRYLNVPSTWSESCEEYDILCLQLSHDEAGIIYKEQESWVVKSRSTTIEGKLTIKDYLFFEVVATSDASIRYQDSLFAIGPMQLNGPTTIRVSNGINGETISLISGYIETWSHPLALQNFREKKECSKPSIFRPEVVVSCSNGKFYCLTCRLLYDNDCGTIDAFIPSFMAGSCHGQGKKYEEEKSYSELFEIYKCLFMDEYPRQKKRITST